MTLLQALVLAIMQGITELFPISSLGHTVIIPALLGWGDIENSPNFLPLITIMHLGTACALLGYFWKDWWDFGKSIIGRDGARNGGDRHTFVMLIIATIPAAVFGFLLEKYLKGAFAKPMLAAGFLVLNGIMLLIGERVREGGKMNLDQLTWEGAIAIGLAQATALIPGISRSGATMIGGVIIGLTHRDSARFSFLMATPIIFGAAAHQSMKLDYSHVGMIALISFIVSGVFAYASTWFLMRYFKNHEAGALAPFAYYCAIFGLGSIAFLNLMA